jgi:hypothetical protein
MLNPVVLPALYNKNIRDDHRQVLVAHACNPNYSGGRDQEDHSSQDPISKKKQHKKGLVDWLQV